MIVVADSSSLLYLILLNQTALLHRLYGDVLVPDTVTASYAPHDLLSKSERLDVAGAFVADVDPGDSGKMAPVTSELGMLRVAAEEELWTSGTCSPD